MMRRLLLLVLVVVAGCAVPVQANDSNPTPVFNYPVGIPGQPFGDGFFIRHGYGTENTWFAPGYWHTAEDWYLLEGNSAGAIVYAVADGEVVYADGNYPGRIVIVKHQTGLYSMYGHLDPQLTVRLGDHVRRSDQIGTVFNRTDTIPSHLHFEIRTFMTTPTVNGPTPRYDFPCTTNCPPGPGYWPSNAFEHPSLLGWRNPVHVISQRIYDGPPPPNAEVIVATGATTTTSLWSEPSDHSDTAQIGELQLEAGAHYRLISIATGPENSQATSATGYRLWYRIEVPKIGRAWVQAALPSSFETGLDGRSSSIRFNFLPDIIADQTSRLP